MEGSLAVLSSLYKLGEQCLLYVFFLQEEIQEALKHVCVRLPQSMEAECEDLVKAYTNELIELLIADLKPEEICEYLKLCTDKKPASKLPPYVVKHIDGNIGKNMSC